MELNKQLVSDLAKKLSVKPEVLTTVLTSESTDSDEVKSFQSKVDGLQIFSEDELQTRISNENEDFLKKQSKEISSKITGNLYGALDKRIFDATGIEKLPSEEKDSVAYAERAFKQSFGNGSKPNEELERLRKDLSELRKTNEKLNTDLEEKDRLYIEKENDLELRTYLNEVYNQIPFDTEPEFLPFQKKAFDLQVKEKYDLKRENGKVMLINKETGEPIRDPKTAQIADPRSIILADAPKMAKLKQDTVQKQGTGFKAPFDSNNYKGSFQHFNSMKDFTKHIVESGINPNSKEALEMGKEFMKARPELFDKQNGVNSN